MADTFSNDLRVRLQESGSNAGSWGDLLNGTITNIASGFGQGSEAIPNASTHTITLADGTADEARSLYLKLTGGGQACTVTLGPNTISKVWIIDNATSYTLTFSQGSGANVAIAAGAVKVIATDGAGSGAAVVDTLDGLEGSLSSLAVTGALTVDTTTLVVDATNNRVGIGTSSPSAPLDIKLAGTGTADIFKFQRSDGAVAGVLNYNGTDGAISLGTTTAHPLAFDTNNTERMLIQASGTVKISHADTASEGFRVIQTTAGRTSGGALALIYDDQAGTTQPTLVAQQNGTGDILQLFDGGSQVVTVQDGGNLLVGTTSSSGDTANDNPVVAGNFTTKYGITSIASVNTWTTVHTFGSNQGNFMVSMRASGTGNTAHNSVSIVAINQSATTSASLLSGSAVQIRIVGLSLQVLQNVFAGANINWSIMSIGN